MYLCKIVFMNFVAEVVDTRETAMHDFEHADGR